MILLSTLTPVEGVVLIWALSEPEPIIGGPIPLWGSKDNAIGPQGKHFCFSIPKIAKTAGGEGSISGRSDFFSGGAPVVVYLHLKDGPISFPIWPK